MLDDRNVSLGKRGVSKLPLAKRVQILSETVRSVDAKRVQCDEIWSYCYAKAKTVGTAKAAPECTGDVWTWAALDATASLS